ncbi:MULTISPECIES: DUF2304 domain-containing protein [unclassified Granulicatella]|uniref:DUF2304 domain-containing protein n=1 Tax=unclassified Granulicatella TaxID=2630493 RepID=UPI001073A0FE|nr:MULTISPECIES: DUF2304 domain-containing protein [unclassified Granulicatella]MBF0780252.1 DUF2304 domain-containing protein [Granulicatella sp. 19428wC4_WM01]TFU95633.1 DUF2304 domain-containing protein [Granulicatella sp. WM01]
MSILFQGILIGISLVTGVFILRSIIKSQVQISDAIFWILFSLILLLFSIFPVLAEMLASLLGIASAVNFIFLFVIFLLLMNQFQLTAKLSKLDSRFKHLAQTLALKEKENETNK